MDLGTLFGLILAGIAMIYSVIAGGGSFSSFVDYPSIICVFGGGIAAGLICFPLKNVFSLPQVLLKSLFNKVPDTNQIITQIVSLAETARRNGLLALESQIEEIDNKFIKMGIQMAVDGSRPEVIEEILRTEMDAVAMRHRDGKQLLDIVGKYCPAFGMIGTLLGLVIMLGNMSDPSSIGGGMAVALLTTLYGAVAANAFFLPLADKLAFFNRAEQTGMDIIVKGIMAIQSGENPRVIEQKLVLFLTPKARAARSKTTES